MLPLQREYYGHQIVSSADMRRHEVFTQGDHPQSIGVHKTLAEAIAQTLNKPITHNPPIVAEAALSVEELVEENINDG